MIHLENPSIAPCTTRRHLWKVNKACIVIDSTLHIREHSYMAQFASVMQFPGVVQDTADFFLFEENIWKEGHKQSIPTILHARGVWEQTGKMLRFKFYYLGFMHSISQCSDEKDFQGGGGGLGSWLSSRGFALLQMKLLCILILLMQTRT